MKQLLTLLLSIAAMGAIGQKTNQFLTGPGTVGIVRDELRIDTLLFMPQRTDTNFMPGRAGAVIYRTADNQLYVYNGTYWGVLSTGVITASNGLTKVGNDIKLGGNLTAVAQISLNEQQLVIGGSTNGQIDLQAGVGPSDNKSASIVSMDSTSLGLSYYNGTASRQISISNTGIGVADDISNVGVTYADDYFTKGSLIAHWIPDIAAVRKTVHDSIGGNYIKNDTTITQSGGFKLGTASKIWTDSIKAKTLYLGPATSINDILLRASNIYSIIDTLNPVNGKRGITATSKSGFSTTPPSAYFSFGGAFNSIIKATNTQTWNSSVHPVAAGVSSTLSGEAGATGTIPKAAAYYGTAAVNSGLTVEELNLLDLTYQHTGTINHSNGIRIADIDAGTNGTGIYMVLGDGKSSPSGQWGIYDSIRYMNYLPRLTTDTLYNISANSNSNLADGIFNIQSNGNIGNQPQINLKDNSNGSTGDAIIINAGAFTTIQAGQGTNSSILNMDAQNGHMSIDRDNGFHDYGSLLNVGGTLTTGGLDNYNTNIAGSYTARSKVDKRYVDSSLAASIPSLDQVTTVGHISNRNISIIADASTSSQLTLTDSGDPSNPFNITNDSNAGQVRFENTGGLPYIFDAGIAPASINTAGPILSSDIVKVPTVASGDGSGGNLLLQSTTNATKGKINLGSNSTYDEVNTRLGIGNTSPANQLVVEGNVAGSVLSETVNSSTSSGAVFAGFRATNSSAYGQFFKCGIAYSTYKTLQANDLGFYNQSLGNISFLNDNSSGSILFASGAHSTPDMTIASTGFAGLNTSTPAQRLEVNGQVKIDTLLGSTNGTDSVVVENNGLLKKAPFGYGTYTPTLTGVNNVSSTTAHACNYLRVGNSVTMAGSFGLVGTSTGVKTDIGVSLPPGLTSTLASGILNGGGGDFGGTLTTASNIYIVPDIANARANITLALSSTSTTTVNVSFSFTYLIE